MFPFRFFYAVTVVLPSLNNKSVLSINKTRISHLPQSNLILVFCCSGGTQIDQYSKNNYRTQHVSNPILL